ncbi:MAG: hypothetical protein JJE22_19855 [Bacteroidia bacterium]|nr:hypothetical protein [Bacteroidia bacterium]
MKKIFLILVIVSVAISSFAQDSTLSRRERKQEEKDAKRERINSLIKQSEEGALIYSKQSIFGLQFRTNGYGAFYELGKMKTTRKTNIYRIDITEIKNAKEDKLQSGGFFLGNPYIYGKVNNFYQVTLGFGQQYMLGQKGNKNGVAVSAVYNGGLALGLLKPYYLEVQDQTGANKTIKYSVADSALFVGPTIIGGGGLGKGWSEIKVKPGAFLKTALRFDYGRFNEIVSGIEAGLSLEYYSSKIPIMLQQNDRQLFFQGYISVLFGRRK